MTAFYDARGRRVLVHQGGFTSETQLAAEIDRYALGPRVRGDVTVRAARGWVSGDRCRA